jgi:hypothetical protein
MRQPNWSGYASESAADFAAEDRIGAYTVEEPTPEEDAALSLELARENADADAAHQAARDRDRQPDRWPTHRGLTEQERAWDAYCTEMDDWEREAQRYLDGTPHPRPEEVG